MVGARRFRENDLSYLPICYRMPGADRYNAVSLESWIRRASRRRIRVLRLAGWDRRHPSDPLRLPNVPTGYRSSSEASGPIVALPNAPKGLGRYRGRLASAGRSRLPLVFFLLRGRVLVEVFRETCLLALVEVLPPGVVFGGRVVGVVPLSVVDDDACEIVAFGDRPLPKCLGACPRDFYSISFQRAWRRTALFEPFSLSYQMVRSVASSSSIVLGYPKSNPAPSPDRIIGSDQVSPWSELIRA